jgi:hypothetical protein
MSDLAQLWTSMLGHLGFERGLVTRSKQWGPLCCRFSSHMSVAPLLNRSFESILIEMSAQDSHEDVVFFRLR